MTSTPPKPTVFIGSSVEGLDVAYALQQELEHWTEPTVWPQGVFLPTRSALTSLLKATKTFACAIFVFTHDDVSQIRGTANRIVRDNVIFELGLFLGAIGEDHCFIVQPRGTTDLHLPTDLAGMSPLTYEPNRSDKNLQAAIGPVATTIRKAIATPAVQQPPTSSSPASPQGVLNDLVLQNTWRLHFDPKAGVSKAISFEPNGSIGVGSNRNEHTWKISSTGHLEIYQQDGLLHSRFVFNSSKKIFLHTNDADTRSKRDQYIEMARQRKLLVV